MVELRLETEPVSWLKQLNKEEFRDRYTLSIYYLAGKQLELLKTAVPGIRRVAVLFNNSQIASVNFARDVELAAKTLGVQAYSINWDQADRLVSAFGEVKKVRADSALRPIGA